MLANILIIGAACAVALLLLPRFLGRKTKAMLAQYAVLEKRFRLQRKTFRSRWGIGIAERYALSGDYRGYAIAVYDHYQKSEQGKRTWTSLTLEAPFAGELEVAVEMAEGDVLARFQKGSLAEDSEPQAGPYVIHVLENGDQAAVETPFASERLAGFRGPGAFRLSKGFLEYRESGLMDTESTRLRFQEALMIMAEWADGLSERPPKQAP